MVWPVFKTAMETPPAAPVGSIPTRSRHLARSDAGAALRVILLALRRVLALLLAGPCGAQAPAQATTAVPPPAAARHRCGSSRISPLNAFWRSFLLPGWGQARLNRKLTGGIFVAWEGVTLGMSLKTRHELAYLRRTGSARAEDKRQEHEDWLVLLAFNHLFAGLEAYVVGPPRRLSRRPPDRGGARRRRAPSVSVPIRLR